MSGACQAYRQNKPQVISNAHTYGAAGGVRPPIINPFWAQTAWYIDPANTSTCASDSNNCSQSTCGAAGANQGPCSTYGEIAARWGGISPNLVTANFGTITINIMSSQTATQGTNDPMALKPRLGGNNGTLLMVQGTLTTVATTTISALTAKNRGTHTSLQVTLAAAGASINPYTLLTNTTHASTAFPYLGTGPFNVTQPLSIGLAGASVSATEVDTWAVSDSITISTIPKFHITQLQPDIDFMGEGENSGIVVKNVYMWNPQPNTSWEDVGDSSTFIQHHVSLVDGASDTTVLVSGPNFINGNITSYGSGNWVYNGTFQGGFSNGQINTAGSSHPMPGWEILGGFVNKASPGGEYVVLNGALLDLDVYVKSGQLVICDGLNYLGLVHTDATIQIASGVLDIQTGAVTPTYIVWGTGTIDSARGRVYYASGAGTAAAAFLQTGGVKLAGLTVGCLHNPAAATTTFLCNLAAATGANLDTSLGATVTGCLLAGASGFCNTAM